MRSYFVSAFFAILLGACSALSQPTPTPSATATSRPTATPAPTDTATPSPTSTNTALPSLTPTATATFTATPTFTPSPTPTITPYPAVGFVFDNWVLADIPDNVKDGISNPMVVLLNTNNQQTIANIATAQPNTGIQTLYLVPPTNPGARIPILELASNTRLEVFLAKPGNALAFVKRDEQRRSNGLYILDLSTGFAARVLPGDSPLVQRGFYIEPDWSPDGSQLAMSVTTGYDIDIFLYAKDGSGRRNITDIGSYDLWPRWSPDGTYIAFVSDRADCPSWIPGEENACDAATMPPPTEGNVYVLEVETDTVKKLSDVYVSEPPYWINERLLAFASGNPLDLLDPRRRIWRANIATGDISEVRPIDGSASASYLSEAWSPDGQTVLLQVADDTNQLVLLAADGSILRQDSDLDFPRFGMSAAWSPDGQRIAIGGTAGQCPYGVRVKAGTYRNIATGNPPPSMCDPMFSPDSQYIAFSGVNPRVDGRNDVYVANYNGFGSVNMTAALRGQMDLLGWVGGTP
ncbi:MAG: hypothetical protein OXG60_18425 [Chloroflexi bacterium]|nr:hypothetical protein [Chloroflexota bacterium]